MKATQSCTIEGCKKPRGQSRGWCGMHYSRWQRHGDANWQPADDRTRFERLVDRSGDCHRWTGAHHGKGYGHFNFRGRIRKAHTVALILAGVDVPEDMTVDHVWARGCKHKDCVRIDHLEVVPGPVNTLRGGNPCAVNARKTHCKRGHEFTPENTGTHSQGRSRYCKTCIRLRNRGQLDKAAA